MVAVDVVEGVQVVEENERLDSDSQPPYWVYSLGAQNFPSANPTSLCMVAQQFTQTEISRWHTKRKCVMVIEICSIQHAIVGKEKSRGMHSR